MRAWETVIIGKSGEARRGYAARAARALFESDAYPRFSNYSGSFRGYKGRIYSYDEIIAWEVSPGVWELSTVRHSVTTSNHQRMAACILKAAGVSVERVPYVFGRKPQAVTA